MIPFRILIQQVPDQSGHFGRGHGRLVDVHGVVGRHRGMFVTTHGGGRVRGCEAVVRMRVQK